MKQRRKGLTSCAVSVGLLAIVLGSCADQGTEVREDRPLTDLTELVGPFWVPVSADGSFVDAGESYWRFGAADGRWTISGIVVCNHFDLEPTPTFDDAIMSDVSAVTTTAACGTDHWGITPVDGMRFSRSDDNLLTITSDQWRYPAVARVTFAAASAPPTAATPTSPPTTDDTEQRRAAERQAHLDAEAAKRPQQRAELDAARERWRASGLDTYLLTFGAACLECPSFPRGDIILDRAHEIEVVDGATDSPWAQASVGGTIDSWFDYLDASLEQAWSVDVTFDPQLGFPTYLTVTNREYTKPGDEPPFESFAIADVTLIPR